MKFFFFRGGGGGEGEREGDFLQGHGNLPPTPLGTSTSRYHSKSPTQEIIINN